MDDLRACLQPVMHRNRNGEVLRRDAIRRLADSRLPEFRFGEALQFFARNQTARMASSLLLR
jgi:hypothetical protein